MPCMCRSNRISAARGKLRFCGILAVCRMYCLGEISAVCRMLRRAYCCDEISIFCRTYRRSAISAVCHARRRDEISAERHMQCFGAAI